MSPKASHTTLSWIMPLILCRGLLPNHDEDHEPATSEITSLLAGDSGTSATAVAHSLTSTKLVPPSSSMSSRNERERMVGPVAPTYTGISVTTDDDVHVLLKAVNSGKLPLVQERPTKEQQGGLVHSGNCYIFDELKSRIQRWTDGRRWVHKKVHGKFTVCSEDDSIGIGPRFKKYTYRVQRDNAHYHIIAYSKEYSYLTPASRDQKLRALASIEDTPTPNVDVSHFATEYGGTVSAHTDVSYQPPFAAEGSTTPVKQQPWTLIDPTPMGSAPPSALFTPTGWGAMHERSDQNEQARLSEPTSEYFRAFVEACPHLWDLPAQLNDCRQHYFHRFLSRVAPLHNRPDSACFAATETFALDHQGTPSVLAFLAVLREQYDIFRPDQYVDSAIRCRNELSCDFVILPISTLNTPAPFSWLAIQTLGSNFRDERLKRAAWALGQLPPGTHAPDSPSFKWVRQVWNRESLRSGSRQVVDLLPGNGRQKWPPLRSLKTRLYHPANLALNSELMSIMDEKLRSACSDSLQEWCIALIHQLARRPIEECRLVVDLYRNYMVQVTELQINAFHQTGYTHVLHTCQHSPCHHGKSSLSDVKDELVRALQSLADSLIQCADQFIQYPYPTYSQKQYASVLGLQCYWLQTSYVLLSPAERLHYDCLCRTGLNTFREELTDKIGKLGVGPVLIWNYLPDDVQTWAAIERERLGAL